MKIKNFKEKLFLFISLIFLIKTELMIIGPSELSSIFNNQPIEIAFRKSQDISNFYVNGQIFFENTTIMHSACSDLGRKQNDNSENFKILLAYNGYCSILQKVRNAQNSGASMLLLINNNDQDINSIFLDDDSGNEIKIPIAIISLENGRKIQNFIENYPKSKIMVEINFQNISSDKRKIEFKLFFSSSELKAYELISNMTKKYDKLFEHINFIPIYITHQSPTYNPENPVKELNCVSKGKYCYFPKETTIVPDGEKILIESLRQKCMFIKNEGKIDKYFDYMNKFYSHCLDLKVKRLDTLERIKTGKKSIVVTNLMGYLRYLPSLKEQDKLILHLSKELEINRDELISKLIDIGYKQESIVTATGEYAVRGYIVDIFPIEEEHPIRIEFFGDEIESIRFFDESTQLSINEIKEFKIRPFQEVVSDEHNSIYDYLNDPNVFYVDYNQILNG